MTDRPIKVCALLPYPLDTVPGQRFRIEQWQPYLEEQGVAIDCVPFADKELLGLLHKPGLVGAKAARITAAFLRRIAHAVKTRRYDAVLIHRAACLAGPALIERAVAMLGRPIIYDFDDAIFLLHTTEANRRFGWVKFPGKTASICRLSAHVVAGNSYLADYARRFNPRVTVVPTSVDTDYYVPVNRDGDGGRVMIGWTGSSTSQTHLEMFAPVLKELVARRPVEVLVVSDREPVLPGIDYKWRRWSPATEIEDISLMDIGIMPTPDDDWSRGKCSLKALQYMAVGIPAICSAVGTNREVIRHGENGLLASTREEWLACFETLIDDAALRRRLGGEARRTVEQKYSMRKCAALFAAVARGVVDRRPVASEQIATS